MAESNGTVGICLMKGDEAEATINHLVDQSADIRVEDHVTYFRVMTEHDIRIDLREVATFLGRDLSMSSFLLTLSAYFGQIDVDGSILVISPVAPDGSQETGGVPPAMAGGAAKEHDGPGR